MGAHVSESNRAADGLERKTSLWDARGDGWRRVACRSKGDYGLLLGEHGFEEEKIGKVELDSRGVPDGEYMLEYFFSDYHREQVRVTKGVLTAA